MSFCAPNFLAKQENLISVETFDDNEAQNYPNCDDQNDDDGDQDGDDQNDDDDDNE